MRILQVNTQDEPGGAAEIARNLHRSFRQQGHEAWMAVGHKQSVDEFVLRIPNQERRSVYVRWLKSLSASMWKANDRVPGAWRLSKILAWLAEPVRQWSISHGREDVDFPATGEISSLTPEQPDIIHCHNLHGGYFDLRALPRISHQTPTVLTLHDAWLLSGHCAHSLDCERWKAGCGACPYPSLYPAIKKDASAWNWHRKSMLYQRSRLYVTTPCQWLMKRVESSMLASAVVDARVIPNGVDLSVFSPGDRCSARRRLGLPEGVSLLLFAADGIRNNPWKDFATMRSSVQWIGNVLKSKDVWFVALGESSPDEKIGRAVIRFVPHQKDVETVVDYYRAADIYLHAAAVDTFPTTILEAMACGTPVVATNVGGIAEQVDDGETGFLVPPQKPELMGRRILNLLEDDELAKNMRHRCREQAVEKFSRGMMADRYLEWYTDILEQSVQPGLGR